MLGPIAASHIQCDRAHQGTFFNRLYPSCAFQHAREAMVS